MNILKRMEKIEAVLVDMDGTLIDTAKANAIAYAEAFRCYGISVDAECFVRDFSGRSWRHFIPILAPNAGAEVVDGILKKKRDFYRRDLHNTRVNEALAFMIDNFRLFAKVALVTTASKSAVDGLLDFHDLSSLFDLVVTGDDVLSPKPDPEGYALAARRLGVAPSNCLVIEDSEVGVASGRHFGARVLKIAFQ